jgi:5'-nucleotidase
MKPRLLITNDDGIDSFFLRVLVEAHTPTFRVFIAAPLREQSWVGRAFSRLRDVHVEPRGALYGAERAWAIDGTPSDCVNIALGNLLADDEQPAAVISGINIGFNISLPLCLSSGTLAGALEGASWGLPALAFSLELPDPEYLHAQRNHGAIEGTGRTSLYHAAAHAAYLTAQKIAAAGTTGTAGGTDLGIRHSSFVISNSSDPVVVHNINFPYITLPTTPVEQTVPAHVRLGKLYRPADTVGETFRFQWVKREPPADPAGKTDFDCLRRGHISDCTLRF